MMNSKPSRNLGRLSVIEEEDGSLTIDFPDDHSRIRIRFIVEMGKRALQVAVIQDMARPLESAEVIDRDSNLRTLISECPLLFTTTCNTSERAWIERARKALTH